MKKIALVTGASYGLGKAISNKLLMLGFKVYGVSRTKPRIDNASFVWIRADLLNNAELNAIPKHIDESSLDLLINNAGVCFLRETLDYTDEDFDMMFTLNFKIHAKVTKLLFEKVTNGLIINISSLADRYPDPT